MAKNTKKKLGVLNGAERAIAGFAGAAAIASGSHAYASIIVATPPTNLPNAAAPGSTAALNYDIDGDTVIDFKYDFQNQQSATFGTVWQANFSPVPPNGINAIDGYLGPFHNYALRESAGTPIGPALAPGHSWRTAAQVVMGSRYRSGPFVAYYGGFANAANTPVRGFLGIRFSIGGLTRYGWIDAEIRPATAAAGSGGMYFFGAAYEDSGLPINAGQTPEPGSLALLVLGAAGILGRRQRA